MLIVYKLESIKREIEIHSRNAIIHVLMSLEYPWANLCLYDLLSCFLWSVKVEINTILFLAQL